MKKNNDNYSIKMEPELREALDKIVISESKKYMRRLFLADIVHVALIEFLEKKAKEENNSVTTQVSETT